MLNECITLKDWNMSTKLFLWFQYQWFESFTIGKIFHATSLTVHVSNLNFIYSLAESQLLNPYIKQYVFNKYLPL